MRFGTGTVRVQTRHFFSARLDGRGKGSSPTPGGGVEGKVWARICVSGGQSEPRDFDVCPDSWPLSGAGRWQDDAC